MDYAEPLIKAKQALKEYEQAVLHGKWTEARIWAGDAALYSEELRRYAIDRDTQP